MVKFRNNEKWAFHKLFLPSNDKVLHNNVRFPRVRKSIISKRGCYLFYLVLTITLWHLGANHSHLILFVTATISVLFAGALEMFRLLRKPIFILLAIYPFIAFVMTFELVVYCYHGDGQVVLEENHGNVSSDLYLQSAPEFLNQTDFITESLPFADAMHSPLGEFRLPRRNELELFNGFIVPILILSGLTIVFRNFWRSSFLLRNSLLTFPSQQGVLLALSTVVIIA